LVASCYGRARYLSSISAKHIGQIFVALISYVHFAHIHSANDDLAHSFNQALINRYGVSHLKVRCQVLSFSSQK